MIWLICDFRLVPYSIEHVMAKMKILKGQGTDDDRALVEPIRVLAEELNDSTILMISTPMWNLSVPYLLKQYIDIVIQPGINFHETRDWPAK